MFEKFGGETHNGPYTFCPHFCFVIKVFLLLSKTTRHCILVGFRFFLAFRSLYNIIHYFFQFNIEKPLGEAEKLIKNKQTFAKVSTERPLIQANKSQVKITLRILMNIMKYYNQLLMTETVTLSLDRHMSHFKVLGNKQC